MPISLRCRGCGRDLRLKDEMAGRRVKCSCGQVFTVPAAAPVPVSRPYAPPPAPPAPAAPQPRRERARPRALTADEATAIVREVAEKHRARGLLRSLGKIHPKVVARARARFAQAMTDGEVPLVLLDQSFLQNGSAGLLLTNERLYSSRAPEPVALAEIVVATFEKPSDVQVLLAQMFGLLYLLFGGKRLENRLLVNGKPVCGGRGQFACWADLLTQLGARSRQGMAPGEGAPAAQAGRGGARPPTAGGKPEWPRLAAAAVSSGEEAAQVVSRLTSAGMPAAAARDLVREMDAHCRKPRTGLGVVLVAVGLGLAVLGLVGSLALSSDRETFIWYGPVLFGLLLAAQGIYRLCKGGPRLTTDQLLKAWEKEDPAASG